MLRMRIERMISALQVQRLTTWPTEQRRRHDSNVRVFPHRRSKPTPLTSRTRLLTFAQYYSFMGMDALLRELNIELIVVR